MRHSLPSRDQLLVRIGAAKKEAGRAFGFVRIQLPGKDDAVTRNSFRFHLDTAALKEAERRDRYYLLRSNLTAEDPAVLWGRYVQLTQIESVFRSLKSELGIRPIYHQKEDRCDLALLFWPRLAGFARWESFRARLGGTAAGTPVAKLYQNPPR